MEYPSYLVHFNPNHDPKTGQFASSRNGKYSIAKTLNSRYKESTKIENKNQRKESLEKQLTDSNLDNYPNLKKAVLKDISDIDPKYKTQYVNYINERQVQRGSNFIKGAIAGTITGVSFKAATKFGGTK